MTSQPRWIWIGAILALIYLCLPIIGMLGVIPWSSVLEVVTSPEAVAALGVSLRTVAISTLICLLIGVPLALVMSRLHGTIAEVMRVIVTIPMVLPPVVAGLALLSTFGRRQFLGDKLSLLGVDIAFTSIAVVMAQVFVALPFLVISLEAALRNSRTNHEQIAATLGAKPTYILFRVTLPMMMPALVSGTALAAARCLGEFGATLTFAGSSTGTTRTIPLAIYVQREVDRDTALVLALILLVLAVIVVAISAKGRRR